MSQIFYLAVLIITAGILIVFVKTGNEGYIMNLGNYGKPVPAICHEQSPVNSECRACSSYSCSDPTNCMICNQKLMCQEANPDIRKIPDTMGKPYVACNACHVSCRNPEKCFECQRKLVLAGVL